MIDSQEFVPVAAAIVREAGELLMSYYGRVSVEYKGEVDLVTEADRKSEALIMERLRRSFPDHQIMAEEGARHSSGSDYRWYVDPLDGTTNFAHTFPVFCVSLGLEYKGDLIAGVVYDPTRNELFAAEKGSGAYMSSAEPHTSGSAPGSITERPIKVSSVGRLAESLTATGFPSQKRYRNPNIHFYHHLTMRSHGVRRAGSAALDLCSLACGRVDGFWEFNLNPWDTAAGVVIVREAGGIVTKFNGEPFDIASKEVLGSNARIHQELVSNFEQIFAGRDLDELPDPSQYRKV